jgi:FkbM family methyltransferase
LIKKARPRDLCVNAGITAARSEGSEFFVMSSNTLNTFSRTEAESIASQGSTRIKEVLRIPTLTYQELLVRHDLKTPDFISIDIEGHELAVLQTMDWRTQRPKVLCVETLTYTETKTERKQEETIAWMKQQGYFVFADTYVNSIFVDEAAWRHR